MSRNEARLRAIRRTVLREWRGADEPADPARNLHRADRLVQAILDSLGARDGFEIEELRQHWREIAGEFLYPHAEPDSVRNGNLVLRVTHPAMRFHLEQMRGELLRKFRDRLGDGRVKSIRFQVG